MANRFFGFNRGQTEFQIVESGSTQTKDVELNLDLSKNITKSELLKMLDEIKNYLLKSQYPAQ